jgi:tocopherol cyclase
MTAHTDRYALTLTGQTQDSGAWVRVPTREGLQFRCRDTTHGQLHLQLWDGQHTPLINAHSPGAGLEIGGYPWASPGPTDNSSF